MRKNAVGIVGAHTLEPAKGPLNQEKPRYYAARCRDIAVRTASPSAVNEYGE
jgi:hypothetical protein